jgi:hypothetical protein
MSELFGVEHYGGPLSEEVMSPLFVKIKLYDGTILEINDAAAQAVESNRLVLKGKKSTTYWPRQNQYSRDDWDVIEQGRPIFRKEKSRFLDRELDVLVYKYPVGRRKYSSGVVAMYYYLQPPSDLYTVLRESGAMRNFASSGSQHCYSVLIRPFCADMNFDLSEPAKCQLIQKNLTFEEANHLLRMLRPAVFQLGFDVLIASSKIALEPSYEIIPELRARIDQARRDPNVLGYFKQVASKELWRRYFHA